MRTRTKDSLMNMFLKIILQRQFPKLKNHQQPETHFHLLVKNLKKKVTITRIRIAKILNHCGRIKNKRNRTLPIHPNHRVLKSPHQLKLSSQSCKSPFAF